ncbi:malonyl-ACP O-methyltransferase BioC [Spongiibacter taiwanensis]|uniref:malonyl-ACP O-methyltransferase BioC n=1 Tax=Spongiibacter taiwanensis TaxID=1748242 RepID=UPI0020364E4E|nr:malonyl-ACP O-methyltransferase BioC [Spongiibacter taiwanensis]USA42513.1 malonyl-ACP O-methyltransferase BioC [Spongiibacter taiwanensis]
MSQLYRERLASTSGSTVELVLLHGWASHCGIWRSLLPGLREHFNITLLDLPGYGASASLAAPVDPDTLLEQVLPELPPSALYVGWSLGGMLATSLADRYPDRVNGVITIGSNAVFVARPDWPWAMAPETFQQFADSLAGNAGRTLKRFNALQVLGDSAGKQLLKRLEGLNLTQDVSLDNLSRGLACLNGFDNRAALARLTVPVLHLLGEKDALVPAAVAEQLALSANQQVQVMPGSGHLPFLSQPDEVLSAVLAFAGEHGWIMAGAQRHIDKQQVARAFSKAAVSYDSVAQLQRRVADHLLAALPTTTGTVLDLGCGTGYCLRALRERAKQQVLALDLAAGMVSYAASARAGQANYWICGDAEDLPLADESVDLVFSSLSLQWCENFAAVCAELQRVLKPGGQALLATLGPQTLFELRQAWQQVDQYTHVNSFADREYLQAAIDGSGLNLSWWREALEVVSYRRLGELTRELKSLGARNVNEGRPGGLAGRQRLLALTEAYEGFRQTDGTLPASYQVWYLCLHKSC